MRACGSTFSFRGIQQHIGKSFKKSDLNCDRSNNEETNFFAEILEIQYLHEYQIDESTQIYISGYASFKIEKIIYPATYTFNLLLKVKEAEIYRTNILTTYNGSQY